MAPPEPTSSSSDGLADTTDRLAQLVERLEAKTTEAAGIADRLEAIEARLARLEARTSLLDTADETVALAADVVDEVFTKTGGAEVDQRLRAVVDVLDRATQPGTLAALARITDKLADMEFLLRIVPDQIAMGLDVVDDELAKATHRGIDVDQRFRAIVASLDHLSDPNLLAILQKVAHHHQTFDAAVDLAISAPGTVGMSMDFLDDFFVSMVNEGVDMSCALPRMVQLMNAAARIVTAPEFGDILDSGLIDRPVVRHLAAVAAGWRQAHDAAPHQVGLFGLLGVLGDADVQRATGLITAFLKGFGEKLEDQAHLLTNTTTH